MNLTGKSIQYSAARRWLNALPFALALVVFVFWGWSVSIALGYPYDGIYNVHATEGIIGEITPDSPAFGKLFVGDRIQYIGTKPFSETPPYYEDKSAGEVVTYTVERNGETVNVDFTLEDPPFSDSLKRFIPLVVAFMFLAVGVVLHAYHPVDEATNPFFLFSITTGTLLTAGSISTMGPGWIIGVFNALLWLVGPLAVHLHLYFPQSVPIRLKRLIVGLLYLIALIGGIPFLIFQQSMLRAFTWAQPLISLGRIFPALNVLMVVVLLIYSYRNAITVGVRGKIRLVVLGGILSALPLVTIALIPSAVFQQPIIPTEYAFLFLVILPLTYGYAIFRHRLIEIERNVNRGATFILVYSILGAAYLVLYFILTQWFFIGMMQSPIINIVLVLVLASIYAPLRQQVQVIVDRFFYGGWYDYRSAVTEISQGLGQITSLQNLANTISERLLQILRLEDSLIFLRDLDGNFSVIHAALRDKLELQPSFTLAPLPKSSLEYLLNIGDVEISTMRDALSEIDFTGEEQQLLNTEQAHLWIPIVGHGQTLGFLALGPKIGGDNFSGEDLDIIRVTTRQLGPLIENVHLLTRLRRYATELEQRVDERTEELHAEKERIETILASVGEGVVVTSLGGIISAINTALLNQSGYTGNELVGQHLGMLFSDNNPPDMLDEIHETLQTGAIWSGESINKRKNNSLYDAQLTFAPMRDREGNIIGYVGSQRDITRSKELDRIKDQFVFDVSHELRTPVTNVGLYLELLNLGREEKRAQYLSVLQSEVDQLKKLIEDVLDLSRLEIGKAKKVAFTDVDLNLIVEQVVVAHRPLAESAGLNLEMQRGENLPTIRGEPNQLARVATNLLSNSIHYTQDGFVRIRTFHDGDHVYLEVKDSGIGIASEDLPHIFERFYRGRLTAQAEFPGTGLGLAIIKEIVDLHAGQIFVESKIDDGSIFLVRLPIEHDEHSETMELPDTKVIYERVAG